ncbi:beta-ketoacyl synthase [Nonomuraea sp. ATR24]|uniref:beta-ketoacyl-[acyl-carrier-protein] synthase family protein n=1 Tax=Nonomuraea sp. ATR24 TaxID=1676744 RepID=UPI0035BFEEC0
MPPRTRIAVTGLGVRTPAGANPKELWNTLLGGRSTARTITSFDTEGLAVDFACQIGGLDPAGYLTPKQAGQLDRVALLAMCAAGDALADAGAITAHPERRAVVTGTGFVGTETYERSMLDGRQPGRGNPPPRFVPMIMANAPAAAISMHHGLLGPSFTVATACASGAHAIGEGARLLRDGSADLVVTGGAEACVTATMLLAFDRCRALSRRTAEPERASRPFDTARDGFVLAEGAAFLVLEPLEDALRRGARVHAELAGYSRTSDGHHLTAPHPQGQGAYRSMRAALADAGLTPDAVAHVNAHGSGTQLNDLAEAQAIARLFGPDGPPVTSTKGVTGHAIGAAGAIEAVASVLTLTELTIPPTANLDDPDERCDIDVVRRPRPLPSGAVVSNSFGFGGHNATLIFTPAS